MQEWIVFLLVGGVAGFLGAQLMKGRGFGLIGNIIVGILGGILGGWLCKQLEISIAEGIVGQILTAVLGAIVLLFAIGLIKKAD